MATVYKQKDWPGLPQSLFVTDYPNASSNLTQITAIFSGYPGYNSITQYVKTDITFYVVNFTTEAQAVLAMAQQNLSNHNGGTLYVGLLKNPMK